MPFRGESDPRSLYPSGTSFLRKPRLNSGAKGFKSTFKAAKIGVIKPIKTKAQQFTPQAPKMAKPLSAQAVGNIRIKLAKQFK